MEKKGNNGKQLSPEAKYLHDRVITHPNLSDFRETALSANLGHFEVFRYQVEEKEDLNAQRKAQEALKIRTMVKLASIIIYKSVLLIIAYYIIRLQLIYKLEI